MKNWIIMAGLLLGMPLLAQTKVVKKNAVKANDFGITYSLPKTSLVVDAEVTKVTCKAGPYYQYAEKYLGVKEVVTEDQVYFELGKITLINRGLPDADNTYIVEFKQGTVAPYAYLTEDGLLCSINAEYTPTDAEEDSTSEKKNKPKISGASVLSEELLMAGSTAKQAEVAAKQIYRIRDSRLNILTGEADNLPPDGDALYQNPAPLGPEQAIGHAEDGALAAAAHPDEAVEGAPLHREGQTVDDVKVLGGVLIGHPFKGEGAHCSSVHAISQKPSS